MSLPRLPLGTDVYMSAKVKDSDVYIDWGTTPADVYVATADNLTAGTVVRASATPNGEALDIVLPVERQQLLNIVGPTDCRVMIVAKAGDSTITYKAQAFTLDPDINEAEAGTPDAPVNIELSVGSATTSAEILRLLAECKAVLAYLESNEAERITSEAERNAAELERARRWAILSDAVTNATGNANAAALAARNAASDATAAAQSARESAGEADKATAAANDAAAAANAKAGEAGAAASRATSAAEEATKQATAAGKATTAANNAATAAQSATQAASTAATAATQKAREADMAAGEARTATQDTLAAKEEAVAATRDAERATAEADDATAQALAAVHLLIPTGLTVQAPKRITQGNLTELFIRAILAPVGVAQNVVYISDNNSVKVAPNGRISVVGKGVTTVHVVPTLNTALAESVTVEVAAPTLRLASSASLRFTQGGGFRLT